jgi:hypothetical protein
MIKSYTLKSRLLERLRSLRYRIQCPLLCSDCFADHGLALEARKLGKLSQRKCPNCNSCAGAKLDQHTLQDLAWNFFVSGSFIRTEYGGWSLLAINDTQPGGQVHFPAWLDADARMIEEKLGVGIFHYGPPLWRLGEIEPLDALKNEATQQAAALDVIRRFPRRSLSVGETFYRLRKGVESERASEPTQYDTPPDGHGGAGRLDAPRFPVLYGSQDLEICVHECRVTKIDECYLATLRVAQPLNLLDLCSDISNDGETPFKSLFLAIQFVFSAENHSYNISRAIAKAAKDAGLHGIAYPSYFSSFRKDRIPNIGLFGYPIAEGCTDLLCTNRLILDTAQYGIKLGPCLTE